jgi:3-hydroxymyristoyl/3-hydroxydecanoyl-(acyl carrier protein) dehydratase
MPLDPAFVEDCPYAPEALLLDEIVEVDRKTGRVVARMAVHEDLPITRHQKVHPVRHPRHMSGGLMVHMTGMMGFVHAYFVLELRHRDGWIGYGAKIHEARFTALATPGTPLTLESNVVRSRRIKDSIMVRYKFEFRQGETVVYEGEQTAMWMKVIDGPPSPLAGRGSG